MIGIQSHFFLLAPNLYSERNLVRLQLDADPSLSLDDLTSACVSELGLDAGLIVQPGIPGLVAGLATWLQQGAGHRVSPCVPRTELGLAAGVALYGWEDAHAGEAAGRTAVEICERLARGQPPEQAARVVRRYTRDARQRVMGPGLRVLLETAKARDIPAIRLQQPPFLKQGAPGSAEIVQYGWGARQVRCQGLLCDRIPEEAVALCADRPALLARLAEAGFVSRSNGGRSVRAVVVADRVVAAVDGANQEALADLDDEGRQLAVRAAQAVGLPVAVVDLVLSPGGATVVNVSPQVELDGLPETSIARVADAFFDWLFPDGADPRIPLALVTGTNGKTTTCHLLGNILKAAGHTVGLVCSVGAYLDGRRVKEGDLSSPWEGLEVLHGRRVNASVMEVARGGLLKVGLGVTGATAGGCLKIAVDHMGLEGIDDENQMAAVKALALEGVAGALVLAADSPVSLALRERARGRELLLVTTAQDPAKLLADYPEAGTVVHVRADEWIAARDREGSRDIVRVADVPVTMAGQAAYNVENAVFAAAFGLAMGCSDEAIAEGLTGFTLGWKTVPGRLCVYSGHPFSVVMDYAHNASGVMALKGYLDRAFEGVRRIGLLMASDRRLDEDILEYARAGATAFDEFVCTEYGSVERRPPGAGTALLVSALGEAGIDAARIHSQPVPEEAARLAMDLARPGDAVIMLGRDDDRAWEIVEKYPERPPDLARESA